MSEFLDNLITERFGDSPEAELLRTVVVNNSNADPNGVIGFLVEIHDKIGTFVMQMQDGEFNEWTAPTAEPVDDATIEIGGDPGAVLELP